VTPIRNTRLDLIFDDLAALSGRIRDRAAGEEWRFAARASFAFGQDGEVGSPGTFAVARLVDRGAGGADVEVTCGDNRYQLAIWLEPGAGDVLFEVAPLAEPQPLDWLTFPGRLLPVAGSVTQLTMPQWLTNGIIHRPKVSDHWRHEFPVAGAKGVSGRLNMPFWGLDSQSASLLAILETADDASLSLQKIASRPLEVAVTWTASLGSLRYPRRLRLRPLTDQGYVAIAKAYRSFVQAQGRFKSLAQKIEERPIVQRIIGGPYFTLGYLPFSQRKFRQVVKGLREIGYTAGLIGPIDLIQWGSSGWLNDYQPFINAPEYAPIAEEAGFAAFAWCYLEDILTWDPYYDPSWLVREPNGKLVEGWFNRDYEYQLICTKVLADKHRLLKDKMTQFDALHFDTTTAKALSECWEPAHLMSRTEDREARRRRLAEVASWGLLVGSEAGHDWAFDVYDFCSSNPRRGLETGLPFTAHHVPLLGLVYHDSIVSYSWEYDPYNQSYFGGDWGEDKLLYDVMAGNPPTVAPIFGYFPVIRRPWPPVEAKWLTWEDPVTQKLLRDALPVAQLHGRTAHMEMVDHAFLDDDLLVTRTAYQDGTNVRVNAGHETFEDSDGALPARSYQIR
jgi:hypothetical protein